MMTRLTLSDVVAARGEFRAGSTDIQERRRSGVSRGPLVDIMHLTELNKIDWETNGAARIGAHIRIAAIAVDERLRHSYPAFAQAAGSLATPQIRAMATLGGNLLQHTRCWYYRHPHFDCYKKGGHVCPSREGNHLFGVCFDLGPCVFPHPSTLGMALMAYDAQVAMYERGVIPVADLYGDGSDPHQDHQLKEGELLTHILLPEPMKGERAAYFRSIGRAWAEWPLVEAAVRLVINDHTISFVRVAVGGVANIPLRLPEVEAALTGQPATRAVLAQAATLAIQSARPLPMTGYKVHLVRDTVLETLERALAIKP